MLYFLSCSFPPNPLPYSYFYESTSTTPENSVQRVENRIEIKKKQAKNKEKLYLSASCLL